MLRESLSLRYDGQLSLLDQRRLPDEISWLPIRGVDAMIEAIVALVVRGAPLIGVAAALCLAARAEVGDERSALLDGAERLRRARPTAVNLMGAMDRVTAALLNSADERSARDAVIRTALQIFDEDRACCERMARHGAALLGSDEAVLTHCNTGGLATAGVGTALGVILKAVELGKKVFVWVDETRPLLQGARLTTWELQQHGVPHTLLTDSMAAPLLRDRRVSRVLVGADRIARNGDFANKIGTYGLAVLARWHGVPFHVVAPRTTVDPDCASGAAIPIETRAADEVRGVAGSFGRIRWAPPNTDTYNPAFDVTPGTLVTSLVHDGGVVAGPTLGDGQWVAALNG